jgi:flagellar protein FlbT
MALKVELKPGERILIGDSVITNGAQRTRFLIDGRSPVLRERDIITAEQANTPAKRIYLATLTSRWCAISWRPLAARSAT